MIVKYDSGTSGMSHHVMRSRLHVCLSKLKQKPFKMVRLQFQLRVLLVFVSIDKGSKYTET